jgi:hypothetical protein
MRSFPWLLIQRSAFAPPPAWLWTPCSMVADGKGSSLDASLLEVPTDQSQFRTAPLEPVSRDSRSWEANPTARVGFDVSAAFDESNYSFHRVAVGLNTPNGLPPIGRAGDGGHCKHCQTTVMQPRPSTRFGRPAATVLLHGHFPALDGTTAACALYLDVYGGIAGRNSTGVPRIWPTTPS